MLAQTEGLCATMWLAYHPVSAALRGTHEVLASSCLVGIADQGSKQCGLPQLARRQEVRQELKEAEGDVGSAPSLSW
jgi:hypothetical protein